MSDIKTAPAAKFEQDLKALQQTYIKRLSSQIAELQRLHVMLGNGIAPLADLQILYRTTHNFAGSGTTFGFPAISQAARALHDALKALFDAPPAAPGNSVMPERAVVIERLKEFILVSREAVSNKAQDTAAVAHTSATISAVVPLSSDAPLIGWWAHDATLSGNLMSQLGAFGCRVTSLRDNQPDEPLSAILIFSDFTPADLTPIEKLLEQSAYKDIPVIAISSRNDFTTRLAAVRHGVDLFAAGEPDLLQVARMISKALDVRQPKEPYHVLVVDDDEMLAEFYGHALQHAGMRVTLATNAKSAVEMLQGQPIDVALINFVMPHCTGLELSQLLRQHECYATLPIVFMSAKEELVDSVSSGYDKADECLVKPFNPKQMVAVLTRRALQHRQLMNVAEIEVNPAILRNAVFMPQLEAASKAGEGALAILSLDGADTAVLPNDILEALSILIRKLPGNITAGMLAPRRVALLLSADVEAASKQVSLLRERLLSTLPLLRSAPSPIVLKLAVVPLKADLSAAHHIKQANGQLA